MQYSIKAIPTTYAGVNFRSRLEARWAAFFDLCGWTWDYEPIDLEGWVPDFKLTIGSVVILVEVKPIDETCSNAEELADAFGKACKHGFEHYVALLCAAPMRDGTIGIPIHQYDPPGELVDALSVGGVEAKWREAGNRVQWVVDNEDSFDAQMRRIFGKSA